MQRFLLIFLIVGFSFSVASAQTTGTDVHVVKKGETLYSLSQSYNTTVSSLLDMNPGIVNNKLQAGGSIKVPRKPQKAGYKPVKVGPPQYLVPITYQVGKGETLYSISKRMDNNVETLRLWNDLKNDDIKAGQKIIVGYGESKAGKVKGTEVNGTLPPQETAQTKENVKAKKNDKEEKVSPVVADTNTKKNNKTTKGEVANVGTTTNKSEVKTFDPLVKADAPKNTNTAPAPKTEVKPVTTTTTIATTQATATNPITNRPINTAPKEEGKLTYLTEKGIASWSKGNNDDGQFYALHPSAPVGTLITVKNMMNNSSVQVKVIGKLPNTADNQNVMIKLSGSAARQLNVLDDKFLATINYMGVPRPKEDN